MQKLSMLLLVLLCCIAGFAQPTIQGSVQQGTAANSVNITYLPNHTSSVGEYVNYLSISIAIPLASSTGIAPTITGVGNFAPMTFTQASPFSYTAGSEKIYSWICANGTAFTMSWINGTSFIGATITLNGGTGSAKVRLVDFTNGGGGANGNSVFGVGVNIAPFDLTDYTNHFYAIPGTNGSVTGTYGNGDQYAETSLSIPLGACNPSPNAGTVSGTSPLCIGGTATYTSDGTAGGTWSSTNTAVATVNSTTGAVTALTAGTTDITYTVAGCSGNVSSFKTLTVNANVTAGTVSGTSPLCIGGTATYTSNGTAGGTWSSTNTAVATVNSTTGAVTALAAGTSNITYTVNSGCGSLVSSFATLTVNANVIAGTVSGTSPLCIGGTATYTSNGTSGGSWSSTNTSVATVNSTTGAVTAIAAGTSNITYTVNSGCGSPVSSFAPLTVNANVTAGTVSGTSPLCIGGTATYTSNGTSGGSWSSTNTSVAAVNSTTGAVTAIAAGTSNITYTVNSGCGSPVSSFKTLTVSPNVTAGTVSGTSPLTVGSTAPYTSNGTAGGTWSSSNTSTATVNATTGLVTAIAVGTTNITYTVNSGCGSPVNSFKALTVTTAPSIQGSIQQGASANSVNITYLPNYTSASGEYVNYLSISIAIPIASATGVTPSITGVGNFASLTFTPATPFSYNSATEKIYSWICANGTAFPMSWTSGVSFTGATISFNGGTTPSKIRVVDFTNGSGGSNGNSYFGVGVNVAPFDVTNYDNHFYAIIGTNGSVTGTYGNGDQYAETNLSIPLGTCDPSPNAGVVSGTSPLCIGGTAAYTSNGTTGGTWSSTNTAVATVNSTTGAVTAITAGTTDITYTVSGCSGNVSSFKTLTVNANVTAGTVTGTSPLCIGGTATYTSNGTSGGTWSSSNTSVATVNSTTGAVTAITAGATNITYTVNSGCGSPVSAFATLTVNATVNAGTVSGTSPLCIGGTATYTSNGTSGGTWSSTNTSVATVNSTTGAVTAIAAGTTNITYTVNSGCGSPVSSFKTLTVNANVSAGTVSGTSPLCIGGTATYTSNGTAGGTWSSTNTSVATVNSTTGAVTAIAAGTSNITYTVNSGCGSPLSSFKTLTVNANVTAGTVTGASPLTAGSTATYTSNGTTGGSWSSSNTSVATVNSTTGLVTAVAVGTTNITYTVNSGCGSPVSAFATLSVSEAHVIQGSIQQGASPNTVNIQYLPNYTSSAGEYVNYLSISIAIPTASATGVAPSITGVGNFAPLTFIAASPFSYIQGTETIYSWICPNGTEFPMSWTAGTSFTGATISFLGGSAVSKVRIVDFSNVSGGINGNTLFGVGVNKAPFDVTNYGNPFYAIAGTNGSITGNYGNGDKYAETILSIPLGNCNPSPNAGVVSGTSPLCIGGAATYTSNGTTGGTWSSTNTAVATVNSTSGAVTAIAAGTTDITYTVAGCSGNVSSFKTLTVNANVTAGTVSGASPLCIGGTATYTSNGTTGGTWSSTNTAVATVNSTTGAVTAIAAGTTNITYTVNSGCGSPVSSFATLTVNANVNAGTVSGTSPLCIGGTATYTSNGTSGGAWSSTNTAVATVNATTGAVTAIAAGTTNISYTVNSGCGSPVSSFKTLTVNANVTAGTVSGTSPLCIGGTATYTSNGTSGGTWSSTNTAVATVNNTTGAVTAVGAGTTNITYTVNSDCGSPVSSFKTLTVNANVTAGTVNGTSPLAVGATAIYTSNGTSGGSWSSTNTATATVNATTGLVTAIAAGTTNITYTVSNGCGSPVSAFAILTVTDAHIVQGSIQKGSSPNTVNIQYLPNYTSATGEYVNYLSISIAIPTVSAAGVIPSITGVGNFAPLTFSPALPFSYTQGSETIYSWICPNGTEYPMSWTSGVSFTGATISFLGGTTVSKVRIVDFANLGGGSNGNTFFGFGVNKAPFDVTAYNNLFYAISGANGSVKGNYGNGDQYAETNLSVSLGSCSNTSSSFNATACDSYTLPWGGSVNASGDYTHTYQTILGCDSVVTAHVTINNSTSSSFGGVACNSYTLPWGASATSSGDYTHTYQTIAGCDSVVTAHITINTSKSSSYNVAACNSYSLPWGGSVSSSGDYTHTYQTTQGCDSVVTAHVTINNSTSSSFNAVACNSYTLPWGGAATASGDYLHTYQTTKGCDSIVTAHVIINHSTSSSFNATACGSYTLPWGTVVSTGGDYTHTYQAVNGCDSIVTAHIIISPNVSAGTVSGTSPLTVGTSATYTSNGTSGGTWSSTNTATATVNPTSGLVTAIAVGTTDIVYTVNSGCGSPVSAFKTLTVNSVANNITVTCPGNITKTTNSCNKSVTTNNPTFSGPVVSLTWVMTGATTGSSGATGFNYVGTKTFNVGVTTITYTAKNASGATVTCSFTVTVTEDTKPTINCQQNITTNVATGLCGKTITLPDPSVSDNCGVTSVTWVMTGATTGASSATGINYAGTQTFNVGTTTITYTVKDASGNTRTCSFTVRVIDNLDPEIACPADIRVPLLAGCSRSIAVPDPVYSDNCAVTTVAWIMLGATNAVSPLSGINTIGTKDFNAGVTWVTYAVKDASGNIKTCNFTVTVDDNINPTITCPGNIAQSAGNNCTKQISTNNPVFSDNCTVTRLTWSMSGATTGNSLPLGINYVGTRTFYKGVTTVSYTARDSWGNEASCSFTVTVTDNTNPVISCPGNITQNTNNCSKIINTPNPWYDDNCGVTRLTWVMTGATSVVALGNGINFVGTREFNAGTTTITYTAKDAAGNTATCSFTVRVNGSSNCNLRTAEPPVTNNPTHPGAGLTTKMTVNAFPNPADHYFNLAITTDKKEEVEIRITDITGKLLQVLRGSPDKVYHVGDSWMQGTYIVEVRQGGERVTTKLVKL